MSYVRTSAIVISPASRPRCTVTTFYAMISEDPIRRPTTVSACSRLVLAKPVSRSVSFVLLHLRHSLSYTTRYIYSELPPHHSCSPVSPSAIPQELIQTSSPSMTSVSSSVNSSGIVVPPGGLQQSNVAMTTINSQVVSG